MAYDTQELFNKAKEAIVKNKLFFIEDIIAFLPCGKTVFYERFPNDSDNYKILFELLEVNRISIKTSMRKKWYDSENPTLQMGLMKLICTDEERKKLAVNYNENENNNNNRDVTIEIG